MNVGVACRRKPFKLVYPYITWDLLTLFLLILNCHRTKEKEELPVSFVVDMMKQYNFAPKVMLHPQRGYLLNYLKGIMAVFPNPFTFGLLTTAFCCL